MKSFSLSELNRQSGEVVDAAMVAPVSLTKRGKPKLVMMPYEIYERWNPTKAYTIENAPEEVNAELLEAIDEILEDLKHA
jgi:prevent-host-death family protein